MITQAPPRNLFSRRLPPEPKPLHVADYLASLRGEKPAWGFDGDQSPQWFAADELVRGRFFEHLCDDLATLVRLPSLPPATPTAKVVEQYLADNAALADQVEALDRLFGVIATGQTQVVSPAPPHWNPGAHEPIREYFARCLFTPKGPGVVLGPHIITADFVAANRETALAACREDIARRQAAVASYARQCLFDGLASGLLGLVAWPCEDACWYVRNEHRLRLNTVTHSVAEDWRVCKEVHLMDAARLGGIPGWLELPPAVDHVARAIPRILWRHLSTVVGTMIREREIMWLAGAVRLPEDLVRPLREPVIDPAIAIGPIVLTGWETPEHRQPGWWMRLDRYLAGRAARTKVGVKP